MNCTASPTRQRPLPLSPFATADPRASASTSTGDGSTSVTSPPPSTPSSTPGRPTAAVVSTPSSWLPPWSWSATSTSGARDHRLAGTTPGRELELAGRRPPQDPCPTTTPRSPLVVHSRPAAADGEPGLRIPPEHHQRRDACRQCHSTSSHPYRARRRQRVRPEPLKPRRITTPEVAELADSLQSSAHLACGYGPAGTNGQATLGFAVWCLSGHCVIRSGY